MWLTEQECPNARALAAIALPLGILRGGKRICLLYFSFPFSFFFFANVLAEHTEFVCAVRDLE